MRTYKLEVLKDLQNLGYTHIASIVKQVYHTKYYRLVSIDDLIAANGAWPRRQRGEKTGIRGTRESQIDWGTAIKRSEIDAKLD